MNKHEQAKPIEPGCRVIVTHASNPANVGVIAIAKEFIGDNPRAGGAFISGKKIWEISENLIWTASIGPDRLVPYATERVLMRIDDPGEEESQQTETRKPVEAEQ